MINNIIWNGVRLRLQTYNVLVGDAQLELKRCFRDSEGTPVLMVPGFLENTDIFMPKHPQAGLAPFLASHGFDVYLLEMRGKGNSWPSSSRRSRWGVHEAICEDIPSHLGMVEKLRPGIPQFWVGHGLGSLLLTGVFARIESLPAKLLGMVHISPGRVCQLESWQKTVRYQLWLLAMLSQRIIRGYVAKPFADSVLRETRHTVSALLKWHRDSQWIDSVDEFDYGRALRLLALPPSLYLANHQTQLWGNGADCRRWVQELGRHNGRLITVSKVGGNDRNYSYKALLRSPFACQDHFLQIQDWLNEHNFTQPRATPISELMEA